MKKPRLAGLGGSGWRLIASEASASLDVLERRQITATAAAVAVRAHGALNRGAVGGNSSCLICGVRGPIRGGICKSGGLLGFGLADTEKGFEGVGGLHGWLSVGVGDAPVGAGWVSGIAIR